MQHMNGLAQYLATDMIECDLFGPDDDACGERSGYLHMEETDTVPDKLYPGKYGE